MTFLVPNEFLIGVSACAYWEPPPGFYLTLENRVTLRNAGIQTLIEFLDWATTEPAQGQYDFSVMDEMIRVNREAGMKTIFSTPGERSPSWMPHEWMHTGANGDPNARGDVPDYRICSFWNEEAQEYVLNYLRLLVDRYHAPDVLFMLAEFQGGEGILPNTPFSPFCFDAHALADYRDKHGNDAYPDLNVQETRDWLQETVLCDLVRKYSILNQHKEVWNQQQPLMNEWSTNYLNYFQEDVLSAYDDAFPDSQINLMQYTFWDSSHNDYHRLQIDNLKKIFECDVIVEAMWPPGLRETTPKSIAGGYRGQMVGVSYMRDVTQLKERDVDFIGDAHQLWLESLQS